MKPNGVINLVLPAVEIVQDHQPSDSLLAAMGTSTKEVIQMFLNAWAEFKHLDESDMPYYGSNYDGQVLRHSFNMNARLLIMDIIFDAMERRAESGDIKRLDEKDRRDAEQVMLSIWNSLSDKIFSLLEELHVTELQIAQLRFERWIGDDFIVSLPRHYVAHPPQPTRTHNDDEPK